MAGYVCAASTRALLHVHYGGAVRCLHGGARGLSWYWLRIGSASDNVHHWHCGRGFLSTVLSVTRLGASLVFRVGACRLRHFLVWPTWVLAVPVDGFLY